MVKPRNLFLNLIEAVFFLVGLAGAVFMIYMAIDEFLQFCVITTAKIKSEEEMTLVKLLI